MKRIAVIAMLSLAVIVSPSGLRAQEEAQKQGEAPKQEEPKKKMKTRTEVITLEEIEEMAQGAGDALEVVKRLRPKWLSTRNYAASGGGGALAAQEVQVYLDNTRQGGGASLTRISLDLIGEMRYLTGSEASARFGLNHQNGAILVTTRGKVRP
jgi:hypothetical protein